jgi:hypothetical protein
MVLYVDKVLSPWLMSVTLYWGCPQVGPMAKWTPSLNTAQTGEPANKNQTRMKLEPSRLNIAGEGGRSNLKYPPKDAMQYL